MMKNKVASVVTSQRIAESNQPNILNLLDFCKGFFITCIFYYHFHKFDGVGWLDGVGWQGVHPFIVFSGFGLTYSCLYQREKGKITSWKSWFLRRAERLFPTYWLVCLFGFVLSIAHTFKSQKYCDLFTCFLTPAQKLFMEVSFLKTFSYQDMWSLDRFDHLWFIPLIVSFYAIFPLLFKFLVRKGNITKSCIRLLVISLLVEFSYRFFAIYFLDGLPIGYSSLIFHMKPPVALDLLPSSIPFQEMMPFGFFPSRIGEFALGMAGAVILIYHPQKFNAIFSRGVMGLGFLIWLLGCALLYFRSGWIVADFVIAVGLVLIVINLAWICQRRFTSLFSKLSLLGVWSYCIYLTHNFFVSFENGAEPRVFNFLSLLFKSKSEALFLNFVTDIVTMSIFGTVSLLASWMLLKFDRSKLPKWLIQNTLGKVFGIST